MLLPVMAALALVSIAAGVVTSRPRRRPTPRVPGAPVQLQPLLGREYAFAYEPNGYFQLLPDGRDGGVARDIAVEQSAIDPRGVVRVGASPPDPTTRLGVEASTWILDTQRVAYERVTPRAGVLSVTGNLHDTVVRAGQYGLPRGGMVIFGRSGLPSVRVLNARENRGHEERIALRIRPDRPNVIVVTRPPVLGDPPERNWIRVLEPGESFDIVLEDRAP